jgi:hypothetical protein
MRCDLDATIYTHKGRCYFRRSASAQQEEDLSISRISNIVKVEWMKWHQVYGILHDKKVPQLLKVDSIEWQSDL